MYCVSRFRWFLLVFVVSTGCASFYMYDNVNYNSASAALLAAEQDMARTLAGIEPRQTPIAARAVVVLPNKARIEKYGVVAMGPGRVRPEHRDYLASLLNTGYLGMADGLVKRQVFGQVVIEQSYFTEDPQIGDAQYLVWLHLTEQGGAQWYIKNREGEKAPIAIDQSKMRTEKVMSWLLNMEELLARDQTQANPAALATDTNEPRALKLSSSGTGFIITDQGHVLTNQHVVAECGEIRTRINASTVSVETIATDPQNDLALLRLPDPADTIATFRAGAGIRPGEEVVIIGYPLGGLLTEHASITTGVVSTLAGPGNDYRYMQMTAPVQKGNSGGPTLDASGHVVGIVTGKLDAILVANITGDIPQNVNFALKASVAQIFLDANGIAYVTEPSTTAVSPADAGALASRYTICIECWN